MKVTTLEKLRREAGLSKSALARKAMMQPSMICIIEQGRFKPYRSQLAKLANALGIENADTLLETVEV